MKSVILGSLLFLGLNSYAQSLIPNACQIENVDVEAVKLFSNIVNVEMNKRKIEWNQESLTITKANDYTNESGKNSAVYNVSLVTKAGNTLAIESKVGYNDRVRGVVIDDSGYLQVERNNEGAIAKLTCWYPLYVDQDVFIVNKTLGVILEGSVYSRGIEVELPLKK